MKFQRMKFFRIKFVLKNIPLQPQKTLGWASKNCKQGHFYLTLFGNSIFKLCNKYMSNNCRINSF